MGDQDGGSGAGKFLKKADREACWKAKDAFWACLRAKENGEECSSERADYEAKCPPTWVVHFDRKFQYEKFKEEMAKEGMEQYDSKFAHK